MTTLAVDSRRVSVLFVARGSEYLTLPVDCYDERRDARTFDGAGPVVAHPPCRLWCMLRRWSTAPQDEKQLAYFALRTVRRNGGVLEHPAGSLFWAAASLPKPGEPPDAFGGWTLAVSQKWWGHRARKRTWLYIVGCGIKDIPQVPYHMRAAEAVCGGPGLGKGRRVLSEAERERTPRLFAWWLEELASRCEPASRCLAERVPGAAPERISRQEAERLPGGEAE